jgi:hypothetical protein
MRILVALNRCQTYVHGSGASSFPAAQVGETWVQESAFDTSFDTNPKQRCETSGNAQSSDSACLGGFCNRQKRLET